MESDNKENYIDLSLYRASPEIRGRSRFIVQLWWLVQDWLIRPSPQFLFGWRRFLWRLFGAQVGEGVLIRPTAKVTYPWKVKIGARSWIGDYAELYSLGPIEIGSDAVISHHSYLCSATHDYTKLDFPLVVSSVHVEDQAWIAVGCFIAPGVRIGRGSIVASKSVVLEDVPAAMIYGGSPAKAIKPRPVPQT